MPVDILKIILLVSFIGLAVIVTKNRVTNPDVRVQFFESLDMNKKWLSAAGHRIWESIRSAGGVFFQGARGVKNVSAPLLKQFFPRLKTGLTLFGKDIIMVLGVIKSKVFQQAKELKQDMKAFELPHHKKDFFERLDGQKDEPRESHDAQEVPISINHSQKTPVVAHHTEIKEKKNVRGFQVSPLVQTQPSSDYEIDRKILERKEQGLVYAIGKNPRNPNFYKKLGRIYLQMDNREDAKNCFEYALKLGAHDPEIQSFLIELKRSATR